MNELNFVTSHLFISGLDKAGQTPVFICKKVIRLLAQKRISSVEFELSCQSEEMLLDLTQDFCKEFKILNPSSYTFPYIMGMYKAHKDDFHWITNVHNCAFSSIIDFNSKLLNSLNNSLIEVTDTLHKKIFLFTKININAYWIIQNQYEFLINLPDSIINFLTFDIKSCYETIPHFGVHSLMESLHKIILAIKALGYIGFKKYRKVFKLCKNLGKLFIHLKNL